MSWRQVCLVRLDYQGVHVPRNAARRFFIEIAADLEIAAEVQGESVRFSSDGRLAHFLPFVRREVQEKGYAEEGQLLTMLGSPATSRKSNCSALQEDRTPLGNCASMSRTHPPATPTRAITPKSGVLLRRSPDLAEVLVNLAALLNGPKSSQLLDKEFGVNPGRATTETKYIEVEGEGRAPATDRPSPVAAHSTRHREGHGRARRGQSRRTRTPTRDTLSDLRDARVCSQGQLFGLSDPDDRPDVHRPPARASAVSAWHREAAALEAAKKQHTEMAAAPAPPSKRRSYRETSQFRRTVRTEE